MQEDFRDELQILMGGERLEQLMIDAGFVDVKATQFKVEIGDWGPGLFQTEQSHFM